MSLIGIASGAIKIGQKIFQGVKARKEKKAEKKAAQAAKAAQKADDVSTKIAALQGLISPDAGSQSISGAGNLLAMLKGESGQAVNPASPSTAVAKQNAALEQQGGGNMMYVIIGVVALVVLFLFKRR